MLKKPTFIFPLLILSMLMAVISFAQQKVTLKGKVTDASNGSALMAVSIKVKGTSIGTQTSADGTFTLNSVPENSTMIVSSVGYVSQEKVLNGTQLNVNLEPDAQNLNQIIVVGYGTQKKVDVTGAVATIKGEEISKQASINPISSLQGKVAGVNIVNNGSPGASPQITIRGVGSIYGGQNVLYVVDGVWYNDISFLNPGDIASMSILKDASAQSIYGIRAANGVVLITTNKGKKGTPIIQYTGTVGYQKVTNPIKMANATEYATLVNELATLNGKNNMFSNPNSYGKGTDWYGQVLRNAPVTNHQISINGGTESSSYNFSLGYLDQDGVIENNNYKRYTARLVNDFQVLKPLKVGYNVSATASNSNDIPSGISRQLYTAGPVVPVFYADGTYGDPNDFNLGGGNNFNPQATLDFFNQTSKNYRLTGNVYAELKFVKHFTFKTSWGGDFGQAEMRNYSPIIGKNAPLGQRTTQSSLSLERTDTRNWIVENTLTYQNSFGDHDLTLLAGQTAQRNKSYFINSNALNVPYKTEGDLYLSLGDPNRNVTDGGSLTTQSSYFGRVQYAYKNRYSLNASVRADGSSTFYTNGKVYGIFPSFGAGWTISNEGFMKNQKIFDNLKLRGSWGKIGNAVVPINPTQLTVTQTPELTAFFGGAANTGASINSLVPPTIVWEQGIGTDIGLEMAFLKNRLSIETDYYNRKTQNAVFAIPVLSSLGTGSGTLLGNQADIQNRGFEALLSWNDKIGTNFKYTISANIGINENKVLRVTTGQNPIYAGGAGITGGALSTRTVQGNAIGEFFGYKVVGVFQNQAQVDASGQKASAKPGDFVYQDTNGDGVIDGRDRVVMGNPNPKYNYGFNTSFEYKKLDVQLDVQGVAGVQVYNANLGYRFGNENFTKDFYTQHWTKEGSTNTYPSANIGGGQNYLPNSFYVESASYIRIRNIQLGYTFNANWLQKAKISKLRVFATAQNAFNFFKYRGFTPEIGGAPTNAGIDNSVTPLYATYNFGVNVTF